MAPAGGSDSPPDLIYGLHSVREALRAGSRPLQRLLMLRTDRQFSDLVHLAKAKRIPIHIEPPPALPIGAGWEAPGDHRIHRREILRHDGTDSRAGEDAW